MQGVGNEPPLPSVCAYKFSYHVQEIMQPCDPLSVVLVNDCFMSFKPLQCSGRGSQCQAFNIKICPLGTRCFTKLPKNTIKPAYLILAGDPRVPFQKLNYRWDVN